MISEPPATASLTSGGMTDTRAQIDVRLATGAGGAWLVLVLCLGRSAAFCASVTAATFGLGVVFLLAARVVHARRVVLRRVVLRRVVAGGVVAGGVVAGGVVAGGVVAGGVVAGGSGPAHRRVLAERSGSSRLRAAALVAFCVALLLAPYAGRQARARGSALAIFAGSRAAVTAELTVISDPRVLAAKGVSGTARVVVDTDAQAVFAAGRRYVASGSVLVLGPASAWRDVLPGQRVAIDGVLQPPLDAASQAVALFTQGEPTMIGAPPWWQRGAGRVRDALRQAAAGLPSAERGLLPGLVDGDTSGLDPVLVERFRVAGLTHLVAVSGTNCSILIGALLLVLRRLRLRPWLCAALGGVLLIAFVVVARPSPSVLRAAAMASIALVSLAVGRPRQALPSLAAAVLVLLGWDSSLAANAGFAMSVLATAALLLFAPPLAEALHRHRVPLGVAEALAVATAAHLVTAPVVAAISGRISLVAVPANALAEPAVALATVLGFLAAVVAPIWATGGSMAAQLAGWPCRWLVGVADRFGGLAGAAVPWPGGTGGGLALLGATGGLLLLARQGGLGRMLAGGAVVGLLVQIPLRSAVPGWPPPGWLMIACDVGQGDALLLAAGAHSAVEIDTGPDPVVIDRCLRDAGISDVALLALTHFHLDHVGGIVGVLHGRRVGRVVTGPLLDPQGGVHLVDDALRAHRLARATLRLGASLEVGDVHLDVLAPTEPFHGTRSDPNNSSLVLRATLRGTRLLLPGDAEIEAQQALLDSGTDLSADVLKVPHHGSAYSDPKFLAAVHAQVAVISVGLHNDYGHPSPMLLDEMSRLGVPVRRTDLDGDVAVVGTGAALATVVRGAAVTRAAAAPPTGVARPVSARLAVGLRDLVGEPAHRPVGTSARMTGCQLVRSASTPCRTPSRRSCCWLVTRNCSSVAPSARSPPLYVGKPVRSTSPNVPASRSRARSLPNCSGRPCSVRPGWS